MPTVALLLAALLSASLSWGAAPSTCWHMDPINPTTRPDRTEQDNCCGPGVALAGPGHAALSSAQKSALCRSQGGNRGWFPDDTQIQRITVAGGGGYCTAATISLGTCPVTSASVDCIGRCGSYTEGGTYLETCAPGTGTCAAASCAGYPKSHACSATADCGTMRTLGSWGAYGACSATCSSSDCGTTKAGTRTRTRSCTAGTGQCSAASCSGVQVSESVSCSVTCPACAPPPPPPLNCPCHGASCTTSSAGGGCQVICTPGTIPCGPHAGNSCGGGSFPTDCNMCGNCPPGTCFEMGVVVPCP